MAHRGTPIAHLGGLLGSDLVEVSDDPAVLDAGGRWAVVLPYAGSPVLARFAEWHPSGPGEFAGPWLGPRHWASSADETSYIRGVERVREVIAEGGVYQANVCRVLSAPLPEPARADMGGLHALLCAGNPAPYAGMVSIPGVVEVATASPELFLRRSGDVVESGPIKGTGRVRTDLSSKDEAENVMIVDLVRNDLSRVCATGSVSVPGLLQIEEHPGLVHLVSRVRGHLDPDVGWPDIVAATFPPGSVTGAPKLAALDLIREVEAAPREVYCGAVGWVDADRGTAELAVAIRTFWKSEGLLKFGTGAGITWGSDPAREWAETELKAGRLIEVAGGVWPPPESRGPSPDGDSVMTGKGVTS